MRRFKLSDAQREILDTVDDLKQSALLEDHAGYYRKAGMMLRVADNLYNTVAIDRLVYECDSQV